MKNSKELGAIGVVLCSPPGNKSSSEKTSRNSLMNGGSMNLDIKNDASAYSNGASPITEASSLLGGNHPHSRSTVMKTPTKSINASGSETGLTRHEKVKSKSSEFYSFVNKSNSFDEPVLRFSVPFRNNPLLKELK